MKARWFLPVVVVVAVGGCKKEDGSELPSELRPRKASVDPGLEMPKLLEHVPADSPFVAAGLEAVPLAYYAKMKKAFGGVIDTAFSAWRLKSDDHKLLEAVLSEMDGKWSADGIEELGLSSQPRFVVYGQNGINPLVARFEIKDDKVLLATIQRIAKKAGEELPAMETRSGRSYWRVPAKRKRSDDLVVALADKQLVFAVGPASAIDKGLDQILGIDKPKDNMGDGVVLREVMARHGFSSQLVAVVDTKRVLMEAVREADGRKSDSCEDKIDDIAKKVPRIAFGYGELTPERTSFGLVVELESSVVDKVRSVQAEVPGLTRALSDEPLFAFGGGVDIAKGQRLMQGFADIMESAGEACHVDSVASAGRRMNKKLDKDLPEAITKITGFAGSVTEIEFGGRKRRTPMPDHVEGFACVTARDGKELYDAILDENRKLRKLDLKTDGSMHELDERMPVPFTVYAGVGNSAICAAAGKSGKAAASKTLDGRAGKAPFFAASYDWGKYMEIWLEVMPDDERDLDYDRYGSKSDRGEEAVKKLLLKRMAEVLGRTTMTLDITDKGLAAWSAVEIK